MEENVVLTDKQKAEIIIERWNSGQTTFEITTSGSTGNPKIFQLEKDSLIWSANQTLKHFISIPEKQLICLPLNKVGGFMQIIRSLVWDQPYFIVEPSSNPLLNEDIPLDCKIASFTPHQLFHILQQEYSRKKLTQFHHVLIGGGEISQEIEIQLIQEFPEIQFVHTFGMTETYSHFAGRFLGDIWYTLTDNTQIQTNEIGCLQIRSNLTNNRWLSTNDIVKLNEPKNQFQWMGRADFIVNSGGVKIQIEAVENQISKHLGIPPSDFFCWGMPHASFGQELTLFIQDKSDYFENLYEKVKNDIPNSEELPVKLDGYKAKFIRNELSEVLRSLPWENSFERPRRIEFVEQIILTETQKINRAETVRRFFKNSN
jgi:o-succinylbenzoate---CoA ligase